MNPVECLSKYKADLCNLMPHNKRFIHDNFTRWYINVPKCKNGISISQDPVLIADLEFANQNHAAMIRIDSFIPAAAAAFKKYIQCSKKTGSEYPPPDLSKISNVQLLHLREIYRGRNFDKDVSQLIELYKLIGMNNIHLSIPPIFEGVELFGSPLNTHNPEYCSPFEFEKKFGSAGSFWNYKFTKSGLYLCNPPFDEHLIERMSMRLIEVLSTSSKDLTVFITIPVWDSESQKQLGIRDFGLDFRGFTILHESAFMREHITLDKFKYPYFDYYHNSKSPASWTHAIIIANHYGAPPMSHFTDKWSKWAGAAAPGPLRSA